MVCIDLDDDLTKHQIALEAAGGLQVSFELGIFLRVNHSILIGIVHLFEFGSRIAKTPGMALLDLLRSQLATGGRSSHVCLWFRILWRFGRRRILGYETSAGKGENQCECE